MDKHTFIGKRKLGSTDICDFTDYQGIGRDPLYRRYESVYSIVKKSVSPEFVHFLAAPDYSVKDDAVNWYIDEWKETPESLSALSADRRIRYQNIKDATIAHYREVLNGLSGEELQVLACALRYIDDTFIYCCDDKVFLVAWGMTPDTRKHFSKGELVHESPSIIKHKLIFDAGGHGVLKSKFGGSLSLAEGTKITANDIPEVESVEGYEFTGWLPNPMGLTVESDMTFVAQYSESVLPPVISPMPPMPPAPEIAVCRFNAGNHGSLQGDSEISKPIGSYIFPTEIPTVVPKKGYEFKGWDVNPLEASVNGDITFNALMEKKMPWYKKLWLWLTGSGCLKWLLWALLILALLWALMWLFKDCSHKRHSVDDVIRELPRVVGDDGEEIDDNGFMSPIDPIEGELPDNQFVAPPFRDENGNMPPIIREPGQPPVIANRLFLFMEEDNGDVDALAADFKKAYPGNQYSIIGFDRNVKSMLIQIPENERDEIRNTLNSKIPNHKFIVLDEELLELNYQSAQTYASSSSGWHLNAVNASEGWEITKGSPSVTVAVVDDGIDASHPMFEGRIVNAYNVFTQDNRLSTGSGHGTHTAGLAAGSLEFLNKGAAGIAPDCKIMPVQVFDNELCPLSAWVSGIMYAVHKGADVVNISIGPDLERLKSLPEEMQEQIARSQFKNAERLWDRVCKIAAEKNTVLVFAAGNDGILSCIAPENRTKYAITVGAVDQRLNPTSFSNYGSGTDISAPGQDIFSSFPKSDFKSEDGTSMSAPIVAGAVALMKSLKKDLTVEQARNVLYRTGRDVHGSMPPMVQVNLALDAVRRGDFSAPHRAISPAPGGGDSGRGGYAPGGGDSDSGRGGYAPGGGGGDSGRGGYTPGGDSGISPAPGNGNDWDAIRRMIEFYKKKIEELEKQLPENK